MLGEAEFTLDIRPTFVDELDKTAAYIELPHQCSEFHHLLHYARQCDGSSLVQILKECPATC